MKSQKIVIIMTYVVIVIFIIDDGCVNGMSTSEKKEMKEKVLEMFKHAYQSYMNNAYPADELMPLSCKGRYRGTDPGRGDIDDSLGNFTLTLIDTLDTLVVLGEIEEFENAVRLVILNTRFDTDVTVSVFETNIRVLGGLLGGHVLASFLKKKKKAMVWYNDELLNMAKDVGYRLLPAFNTSTGIPYSRVNLKHGISVDIQNRNKDTCTACAGTIILEFAALSRLTGEDIFEEKAHKAMDYLWKQRHRSSDLVGTVINIHNGDWIRRESGVGAGIDSYYEYVLKAYILLGDDIYLNRFNKHYSAVMKYISQGPMLLDVHMHKPTSASRNFMDALLAFWPGLQVLKGDIRPAIKTHEMLYQVIQKHNFLPEAFTTDFRVHWGHHPLRPEFVESTYFLHKATGDSHYLRVGKKVVENMNNLARVPCGFAGIKDVSTGGHEDQMDSYVFAETFKYLYLLFTDPSELPFNIDDYIFTTEAHLLPLSLSVFNMSSKLPKIRREVYNKIQDFEDEEYYESNVEMSYTEDLHHSTCPNPQHLYKNTQYYAHSLRSEMEGMVDKLSPPLPRSNKPRLRASEFIAGNKAQLEMLHNMGIRIATMADGRVQLLHSATEALTPQDAEDGMRFMQEMIELSRQQQSESQLEPAAVQFISHPYFGNVHFMVGTAQFGYNLKKNSPVQGFLAITEPFNACSAVTNPSDLAGKIAVLERGNCMFVDKARNIQKAGAIGGIVIDHTEGSTGENQPLFAMSGDGTQDVMIPMVFMYHKEGQQVLGALKAANYQLQVLLASKVKDLKDFIPSSNTCKSNSEDILLASSHVEGPAKDDQSDISTTETKSCTSESDQSKTGSADNDQSEQMSRDAGTDEEILIKSDRPAKVFQNLQSLQYVPNSPKVYKVMAGSNKVNIEVRVGSGTDQPKTPEVSDKYVKIVSLPDGTRQLQFDFPHFGEKESQSKPELNQIYVEIVHILQTKTNFYKLANQAEYLMAVARLLESSYFGFENIDKNAQQLFEKLSNELEVITEEDESDTSESSDDQSLSQSDDGTQNIQSDAVLELDQSESLETEIGSQESDDHSKSSLDSGSVEKEIPSVNLDHYAAPQDFNEAKDQHLNSNQWVRAKNILEKNEGLEETDSEQTYDDSFIVGSQTGRGSQMGGSSNVLQKNSDRDTENIEIPNNMQKQTSEQFTSDLESIDSLDRQKNSISSDSLGIQRNTVSSNVNSGDLEQSEDRTEKPHRTNDEL